MEDPLGPPTVVTGPEYMSALAKLGYNVETMSSSLPMMTKAANAATSLMDQQFQNNLEWNKAQAANKEAIARANQIDSVTEYNNRSLDYRLKALDQENQQRDLDLQYNKYTLDGREKGFDLQQQLLKNQADESNATIEGRIALAQAQNADQTAKAKQDAQDRLAAQNDLQPAITELDQIQPGDPDFDSKIAKWHTRHLNAITSDVTKGRIDSELQSLMRQRNTLTSVTQTAENKSEIQRLIKENHLPANANYDGVGGIYQDPQKTQLTLAQGHMSETVDTLQDIYGRLTGMGLKVPQDLLDAIDEINSFKNPEGYQRVVNNEAKSLTSNGTLRKQLQGELDDINAYLAEVAKQQAAAKLPTEKITIGKPGTIKPEITFENVRPGTESQYTGAQQQQKPAIVTEDVLKAHPELRAIVQEAYRNKTPENLKKLQDAITAATGGRGYQSGGQVGGDQFLSTTSENFLGTGSTDTVPAMLTPGEFVLSKPTVDAIGIPKLNQINQIGAQTSPSLKAIPGSPLQPDTEIAAFTGLSQPKDQVQHPDLTQTQPQTGVTPKPTPESDVVTPSAAGRLPTSNSSGYAYPDGSADVNGIDRNVWSNVMSEEGPEFSMDGKHMSVFGLWKDAPGAEGDAYRTVRQYGANSLQAYNAVTSAWNQLFLQKTKPQLLTSPGMQELVIADSQHAGGGPTLKIIQQMGGWDAINKMNPADAIRTYSGLREHLWPGNSARVDRERTWALAHDSTLSGDTGTEVAGMQTGGLVAPPTASNPNFNPAYNMQAPIQAMTGMTAGQMVGDPLQPTIDPSMIMGAPPQPDLTEGGVFPPPNRPVYMQHGGEVGGGSAGGFESELDQPGGGQQGQRHRRFHPRTAGMGGMGAQPNIPDPMQRKVAKLSQDFIGGLSSMIRSRPELGGAIMAHAKNMLAATGIGDVRTGGGGAQELFGGGTQREQPMGMNPAMLAMSGLGGEEGSSSEESYT